MRFEHPDHPERGVRLAYCLNLHPAEDLDGVLEGIETITLPLAERLADARGGSRFGVGPWLSGPLALEMAHPARGADRMRLAGFLAENGLEAFTFNAFPYGGFHREGLKESVFRPTWKAPERLAYTLAVAQIAAGCRPHDGSPHTSISTHAGMFGAWVSGPEDLDACADNLAQCALHLARLEETHGSRVVLSIEPEPRSSANDTAELAALLERVRVRAEEVLGRGYASVRDVTDDIVRRHIGACLDACHAAVEFEEPTTALENATLAASPLGKLQVSSALALAAPDDDAAGRERLFALHEPVYLHQVTGRRGDERVRATDLDQLRRAWESGDESWRGCDAWRCHFHVPVDRTELDGLGTTRPQADELVAVALAHPERWGTDELHLEIETYTWSVLPGEARGSGDLVDGLEREYRHVLGRLAAAGWRPA